MTIDNTTIEAIADLARDGHSSELLDPGNIYAFRLGSTVHQVDLTGDRYLDRPKRKIGAVYVHDGASFAVYWAKHRVEGHSEIYADRDGRRFIAVLDAHAADTTDWGGHRLCLALCHSQAWQAWTAADGRYMAQEAFAEHLDDNRVDIREPAAAEMLEIAQTIQGTVKVDWQAGHRLADGQRRIGFVETNSASAGQRGELAIPTQITLGLPVFDGAEVAHQVTARFRHRIDNGQLRLMYKLDRPADVVAAAFADVVAEIAEACGAPVLLGVPAEPA